MIDSELLKLLRCPETRQPLSSADATLVEQLNSRIALGQLRNRGGQQVTRKCDGGLVRKDGQFVYPVCEDIPILLISEAIPLAGLTVGSR